MAKALLKPPVAVAVAPGPIAIAKSPGFVAVHPEPMLNHPPAATQLACASPAEPNAPIANAPDVRAPMNSAPVTLLRSKPRRRSSLCRLMIPRSPIAFAGGGNRLGFEEL